MVVGRMTELYLVRHGDAPEPTEAAFHPGSRQLLNAFDARVSFEFWTRISVPDVYVLAMGSRGDEFTIRRIWQPAV